jgi:FolB domain-containing protein
MTDKIHIRQLLANCIIGTRPRERVTRQDVSISIEMECDLSAAAQSDSIGDTVDYVDIRDQVVTLVEGSQFFLIETLADRIAALCLNNARITGVRVTVDKMAALTGAHSVAVEIYRSKE